MKKDTANVQVNFRMTLKDYKELQITIEKVSNELQMNIGMSQLIRRFVRAGIEENR